MVSRSKEKREAAKADYQKAASLFNQGNYRRALNSVNRAIKNYNKAHRHFHPKSTILKFRIQTALDSESRKRHKDFSRVLNEQAFI